MNNKIFSMSAEELLDLYGIELHEDKTVYDPVEDKVFHNLGEWAVYANQLEESSRGGFSKYTHGYGYDEYDY